MFRLGLFFLLLLPLQGAWLKDLEQAKTKALEEEKKVLLVFTSLKISGACVQFEKRVLSQKEFQDALIDRFVLVHLDVPHEQIPGMKSPLDANRAIATRYGVETYPSIYYLDSKARVFTSGVGAIAGGPIEVAGKVLKKVAKFEKRGEALEKAYEKEGLERARALVAVLEKPMNGAEGDIDEEHFDELARLDPKDSLNFQHRRRAELAFVELEKALKQKFAQIAHDEVVQLVDAYLAKHEPAEALLQKVLFRKLAALNQSGEIAKAKEVAVKVIDLDPESSHGRFAAQILERLKKR